MLLFHKRNILDFLGHDESKRRTLSGDSSSSADSVHVILDGAAEIKLNDPFDLFEVQASRGNICAYQYGMIGFIEAKEVFLPFAMIHVAMQLVDMTPSYDLSGTVICLDFCLSCFCVSFCEISIGKTIPVQVRDELVQKVYQLTVGDKNYYLGVLLGEQESQKV